MKKILPLLILLILIGFLLLNLHAAFAFSWNDISSFYQSTGTQAGYNKDASQYAIVAGAINAVLTLAGAVFIVLIVYGGFLWLISQGAEDKIKKAKEVITYSIIGVVIISGAYAITTFVGNAVFSSGGSTLPGAQGNTCSGNNGVCLTAKQCDDQGGLYNEPPTQQNQLGCYPEVCCIGLSQTPNSTTQSSNCWRCGLPDPTCSVDECAIGACTTDQCTNHVCTPSECTGLGSCDYKYTSLTCVLK